MNTQMKKATIARLLARAPGSSKWWGPPREYCPLIREMTESEGRLVGESRTARVLRHTLPDLGIHKQIEQEIRESYSDIPVHARQCYQLPRARVLGDALGHGVITNEDPWATLPLLS
jgi:hypothetical protein